MQSIAKRGRHSPRGRGMNVAASAALFALTGAACAIEVTPSPQPQAASGEAAPHGVDSRITDLAHEVEDLKRLVHELQVQLPKQTPAPAAAASDTTLATDAPATLKPADAGAAPGAPPATPSKQGADFLRGLDRKSVV